MLKEIHLKYLPLLTLIIYASGFITYSTHLAKFGIVEQNILNIRFISSGVLYVVFSFIVFGPIYYIKDFKWIKEKSFFWRALLSLIISAVMLYFFTNLLYESIWNLFFLQMFSIVMMFSFIFFLFVEDLKEVKIKWENIPMYIFTLGIGSMLVFGYTLEYVVSSFGGAKPYKNVLILTDRMKPFILTNELNSTDTLEIVHENVTDIFILNKKNVQTVKKEDIISRIIIKN